MAKVRKQKTKKTSYEIIKDAQGRVKSLGPNYAAFTKGLPPGDHVITLDSTKRYNLVREIKIIEEFDRIKRRNIRKVEKGLTYIISHTGVKGELLGVAAGIRNMQKNKGLRRGIA